MSQPPNPFKPSAFLERLIRFLLPYFIDTSVDLEAARADILDTLAAYGARTRPELLTAARIIAFGMATLDTLADARSPDLSPALKLRCHGCANTLNRSTLQCEKALDQSLARDVPPQPDPVNDADDVTGALQQAQAALQAHRANRTTPTTQADRNKQLWAGAMIDTLKDMGFASGPTPPV